MTNPLRNFPGILCVAGIALATAMPASAASDEERFADATALDRDGRYSAAYGHFSRRSPMAVTRTLRASRC